MRSGSFNICCPRYCVSRHNGGTSGAPLKPLRVDSALRALSTLRGLKGAPEVPPLCRETQFLGQQMLSAQFGINGIIGCVCYWRVIHSKREQNLFPFHFSNRMEYDRGDTVFLTFFLVCVPPFGSETKGKLSPRSSVAINLKGNLFPRPVVFQPSSIMMNILDLPYCETAKTVDCPSLWSSCRI